jgi:3-oxoacyl-[acyl-carrier protein] reductase
MGSGKHGQQTTRNKENMLKKLKDKVAIVTGSSQGIGAAVARRLAVEGAAVVVTYAKNKTGANQVVDSVLASGGRAVAIEADVTEEKSVRDLIGETTQHFGRLDILVNNSGVYEFAPIDHVTVESYRKLFDTNVLGVLLTTQAATKHLSEGGTVINIGSNITAMTMPTSSVYAGSKAAVESITRVLSKELGPRKIRVNCVLPGPVNTETSRSMAGGNADQMNAIIGMTPLGRIGEPEDIASVVAFLASDDAGWVTGATVLASGGL